MSLGYFADFLAHQSCSYRGSERNLASLEVHLVGTDYLEFHSGICREIREFDTAQKTDPVSRESVRIDHSRMFKNLLQESDPADRLRLPPSCFAVSRILAPVPLCAGFSDMVSHLGIDHIDKVIQLRRNLVVSLF